MNSDAGDTEFARKYRAKTFEILETSESLTVASHAAEFDASTSVYTIIGRELYAFGTENQIVPSVISFGTIPPYDHGGDASAAIVLLTPWSSNSWYLSCKNVQPT